MNPYQAPATPEPQEDHTDPRFRIIAAVSRWTMGFLFVPAVMFFGSYALVAMVSRPSSSLMLFPFVGIIQLISPLVLIMQGVQNGRKIRNHPVVRSGRPLYGGIGAPGVNMRALRGPKRGVLYVTRDAVGFAPLGDGEPVLVPFHELEQVAVRRHYWIYPIILDLHHTFGTVTTFTVTRAKIWKTIIDQLRQPTLSSGTLP